MTAGKFATALCAAVLAAGTPQAAPDLGTEAQLAQGKQVYDKYCAQCHGVNGAGDGHATGRVKPAPRDFTSGKYKFRTTPSGMLPTDDDVARVIREGLPYTSMPGWPDLSEAQIRSVVHYLKTFSEDFRNPDKHGEPIEIPEPPPITEDSVERGRVLFGEQGCAACHGDTGRGNGLSAPTMADDWGDHLWPADMTMRWTFRGGPTRRDIFRTFSTGLNGTPMPSYFDSLEVDDRWHLINYIYSLGDGDAPDYSDLLVVPHVADEFDLERVDELFEAAPVSRFPLVGQIVEPGRSFYPSVTSVLAQAVHNRREIVFRVRWHDKIADTAGSNAPDIDVPVWDEDRPEAAAGDEGGDDFWGDEIDEGEDDVWGDEEVAEDDFWGEEEGGAEESGASGLSDAFALQFPAALPRGIVKPYFLMGDLENPVDLWFVDLAAQGLQRYTARGAGSIVSTEAADIEVRTSYDDGVWTVLFKREMRSGSAVSFAEEQFVPLAFSVWDGFNNERGNKRALSAWFHLYVEPSETVSPVGPMAKAALGTLVVELLTIFFIRRRFRGDTTGALDPGSGSAVPAGGMARQAD